MKHPLYPKPLNSTSITDLKLPITITANDQKTIDSSRVSRRTQPACTFITTASTYKDHSETGFTLQRPKYTV